MGDADEERKEEDEGEEGRERPLSVRDAVGPAHPPGPSPARSPQGGRGGPGPRAESPGPEASFGSDGGEGETRPTPVRELMGAEAGGRGVEVELPARTFRHQGREWVVTVVGTTITGQPPDPGAPLMHLRFRPGEDEESGDAPGERELLSVGRGIDDLYDEELRELLERSRPV